MTNRAKIPVRWDTVETGDAVELRSDGRTVFSGLVDTKTDDGDVVWVAATAGGRRLFHIADGFDLAGVPA